MKLRISLLLVTALALAGWLMGQTAPPTAPQNAPAKTAAPPDSRHIQEDGQRSSRGVHRDRPARTLHQRSEGSNDFRVIDDQRPAELRSFRSETDLPLQVGLLVDASNSVRDRFKFEQEAAIEFLNSIIRPNYDKAFVVGFDATPEVTQDFTDSTEAFRPACACCGRAAARRCTTRSTLPAATN
jgi:Ca-activated chloride channel homolog